MRRGDMEQFDLEQWEIENDRAWKGMLALGIALFLMLLAAWLSGVFFGWLIWGI